MTKWQKASLSCGLAKSQYSWWPTPLSFRNYNFKDFIIGSYYLFDFFFPVTTMYMEVGIVLSISIKSGNMNFTMYRSISKMILII